MNIEISFHTNIPSPYRKHQFELLAKAFPKAIFYFSDKKMERNRPWENDFDGWKCNCQRVSQWKKILRLLRQEWGAVHILAYPGGRIYFLLLLVSGYFRHSRILLWNDAGFPDDLPDYKGLPLFKRLKHRFLLKACVGMYTAGALGRKYGLKFGFKDDQIINTYFSHDVKAFEDFRITQWESARKRIREQLGIQNEKVVLLNISRYLNWKRLVDLAEALLMLERDSPVLAERCELILIGDGECRDHLPLLQKLKCIRVHIVHQMPPDEVLSYYCASDIFVFPSEGDIWGLVVNEALSMGVPVICTDRIGASEVVHEGENGYKVKIRRPDEIARKIVYLVGNDDNLKRFSENANTIESYWRTSLGVDELIRFLRDECK